MYDPNRRHKPRPRRCGWRTSGVRGSGTGARPSSVAFVQFWQHTGQVMIIFIAGLQAIPKELYEAARMEARIAGRPSGT